MTKYTIKNKEYNSHGKLIHISDGEYSLKWEYDDNDNLISVIDSNGNADIKDILFYKLDKNNNMKYSVNINGLECYYRYDSNNNLIYVRDSNGKISYYEYDSNNNIAFESQSDGEERSCQYYSNGTLREEKIFANESNWYVYKYDILGRVIYYTNQDNAWVIIRYDNDGNSHRIDYKSILDK